jgi:hypothetical protein
VGPRLLLFVSILGMYLIGLALQGKVYTPNTGDILDILGFIGQLGMGLLYVLARVFGWGATSVNHPRRLRHQVPRRRRPAQHHLRRRRALAGQRQKGLMSAVLVTHFQRRAALRSSTSVVFGITQRAYGGN